MTLSEEVRTLTKKLAHVMSEVKYIQKRGRNKFHGYNYATEADVNEKVREVLAEQNVIMLPSMKQHTLRETTTKSGNTEYIVCVDMDFTFIDGESGEQITISMSGEGQDVGDKAIYKAISGAQKYALMKVFMIPTGDDPEADEGDDERNHGSKPNNVTHLNDKMQQAGGATEAQLKAVKSAIERKKLTNAQVTEVLKQFGASTLQEIKPDDIGKVVQAVTKFTEKVAN